jgi:kumamolisin
MISRERKVVPIAGTRRIAWPGTMPVGAIESDADILLTAWLRPRRGGELDIERARELGATLSAMRTYVDREQLASETTCDPKDVELLGTYCEGFGIKILSTHWRSVVMRAPLGQAIEAFGATATMHATPDGRRFRHRQGSLHAPPEIAALLRGTLGILEWPRSKRLGALHNMTTPLGAGDVATRYAFPDTRGSGQTIAVLQFRATFRADDFEACMHAQGVQAPLPILKRVDDAELAHTIETEKDIESAIDTQIVAALAPGARIVVFAAPDNERGMLDAIRTAIFDEERPSILSISFGFPEYLWTPAALTILEELFTVAALTGVSVFCSSGDNGAELDSNGQPHVLAPASSTFAHACGGTVISDAQPASEAGWPQSGGGFSGTFEAPPWQSAARSSAARYNVPAGRGVPDVAAQVVPGYTVFFNGERFAMGGTSAVAPAWAALAARLNERLGRPIGFFAPLLYGETRGPTLCDVTTGGNDRFACAAGWDPCTGLGIPNGAAIERALRGS